jgi:hypothetical protein
MYLKSFWSGVLHSIKYIGIMCFQFSEFRYLHLKSFDLCKDRKKHLQKRVDVLFCLIDIYIRVQSLFAWATWTGNWNSFSSFFCCNLWQFCPDAVVSAVRPKQKTKKKIGKSGSLGDCWLWNATQQQIAKEQHVHACRVNDRRSLKRFSL